MNETREIVKAYQQACFENKQTALATVVKVEGSAYRWPGARMLVCEDGVLTGAISGGCLEGDALKKALLVIQQRRAMLVKYDTSDDDDSKLGVGLGCNGIIHILIEPIEKSSPFNPLNFLTHFTSKRQQAVIVTLFLPDQRNKTQPGTCIFLDEENILVSPDMPELLKEVILTDAQQARSSGAASIKYYKESFTGMLYQAFIEVLKPPTLLNIVGAGNDVMPLVNMAYLLGWDVNVIDGRPSLLSKQRFPNASRLIVSRPEEILNHLQPDENTVFALLTHNYNYDFEVLKVILPLSISFIGVLGPKKKLNRILDELKEENFHFSYKELEKVYGPVGLDIGAETPGEIALAILSEIKAVISGKKSNSLRYKQGPIHDNNLQEQGVFSKPEIFPTC